MSRQIVQNQAYYLAEIQRLLKKTFSAEENRAFKLILDKVVRVPSPKILDLNITFWFIKKFYLQIYFGEDKRKKDRKERDRYEKERLKQYKERDAEYYFLLLPQNIRELYNFEQKRLIQDVLKRAIKIPTRKIIEGNISLKLKKKYYIAFFLGFDRRKKKRKNADQLMNTLSALGTIFIYFIFILFIVFFAKTVLNYDIIEGTHGFNWLIDKIGLNK